MARFVVFTTLATALLLVPPALAGQAPTPAKLPPSGPGGIVAIVNQDVITRDELDRRVTVEMEETARRRAIDPVTLERERPRFEHWVIDDLVEQRLLLQDAKKNGVTTEEAEIDGEINRRIEEDFRPNGLNVENAEELYRVLKEKYNYTREEYRTVVKNEIIINRLLRFKYFRNPFVTPGEFREFYRQHPELFETPSELTFRMIAVDNVEEAPIILDKLDAKLAAKEPFEKIARAFYPGLDPEGTWLWKRNLEALKDWLPPLPTVLAEMRPGEIRRRIRVPSGWRYVEMVEVKPGKKKTFEEAQPKIYEAILREYRMQDKERLVERLKKEAHLQVFLPPLPPSAGGPRPAAATGESGKLRDVSPDAAKPKNAPPGGAPAPGNAPPPTPGGAAEGKK
jgi:parvulin-like peptidyl-prolyl isomerase